MVTLDFETYESELPDRGEGVGKYGYIEAFEFKPETSKQDTDLLGLMVGYRSRMVDLVRLANEFDQEYRYILACLCANAPPGHFKADCQKIYESNYYKKCRDLSKRLRDEQIHLRSLNQLLRGEQFSIACSGACRLGFQLHESLGGSSLDEAELNKLKEFKDLSFEIRSSRVHENERVLGLFKHPRKHTIEPMELPNQLADHLRVEGKMLNIVRALGGNIFYSQTKKGLLGLQVSRSTTLPLTQLYSKLGKKVVEALH